MKLNWAKFFAICCAFCVVSCNGNYSESASTFGAVYPLSGNGAQYGEYFYEGTEIAARHAVIKGTVAEGQIDFIYEDGRGLANESIGAARKLIEANGAIALLSDLSSVLVPMKRVTNRLQIPVINSSSFSSAIEDADDFMFSILPNAESYAARIADVAATELGAKTAIVVYRNDDMGISFNEVFRRTFTGHAGRVLASISHNKGETEFSSIVTQLLRANDPPDIVFGASYGVEVARLISEMRERGLTTQVITFQGFVIPDVFEILGRNGQGTVVVASPFTGTEIDPDSELGKLAFELTGDSGLNFYSAAHYDAASMLIDAVVNGAKTGEDIAAHLSSPGYSFDGLTGRIVFNEVGLAQGDLATFVVEGMKFVPYDF